MRGSDIPHGHTLVRIASIGALVMERNTYMAALQDIAKHGHEWMYPAAVKARTALHQAKRMSEDLDPQPTPRPDEGRKDETTL
jgi:hypothetical protein